jgi:hypothetical protein
MSIFFLLSFSAISSQVAMNDRKKNERERERKKKVNYDREQ